MAPIQSVLVLGAGTSGSEIATQCALADYRVTVYEVNPRQRASCLSRQRAKLEEQSAAQRLQAADIESALSRITVTGDAESTAQECQLVCESVTESIKIKRDVLRQFSILCPPPTIITTNTSYFLPSMLSKSVVQPRRFAALHFHVPVWYANVADIMPHEQTSPEVVDGLVRFAASIGQIPIVAKRENHGYVFNAMLRELLNRGVTLAARGVTSFEDVDRAWMGVTKMPVGPFGMIDKIGLDTVHDIVSFWGSAYRDPQARENAKFLTRWTEQGLLGVKSGQGFYRYPDPAFSRPDFLSPDKVSSSAAQFEGAPSADPAAADAREPTAGLIARRYLATRVPDALEKVAAPRWHGPAVIHGFHPVADHLERLLTEQGIRVWRVPSELDSAAVAAWFEQQPAAAGAPVPHLFLCSPLDSAAACSGEIALAAREEAGIVLPYLLSQAWYRHCVKTKSLAQASVVVAGRTSSEAGERPLHSATESGGLTGMIKSAFMEGIARGAAGPVAKAVAFASPESPSQQAASLLAELAAAQQLQNEQSASMQQAFEHASKIDVAYRGQERTLKRFKDAPLSGDQPAPLQPGDVWIVSGGARGITAYVARELGRKFGLHLHLLGTTAVPEEDYTGWTGEQIASLRASVMKQAYAGGEKPNVAWQRIERGIEVQRNLHRLRQAGVPARYHACDLSDSAALAW